MVDIIEMVFLSSCVILVSMVSEVGSQRRQIQQRKPQRTTEQVPLDDMLSVLQDAMSGNEVSFSALEAVSDLLPADLTVEPVAVPFVDNSRTKWSVPQTKKQPASKGSNNLQNILTNLAELGNNNPQVNNLLQASSVVIPLDNLQFLNGGEKSNKNLPSTNNIKGLNQNNNRKILQTSETRQAPVRRTNTLIRRKTFPIKFPRTNTAIYIPTSLLSRIRRQTPKGFLVLPVVHANSNQTVSHVSPRIQFPNINNGSVLLVVRRSPSNPKVNGNLGNSLPNVSSINSNNVSANIQGILNRPVSTGARRPSPASTQIAGSVNSNNRPISNVRNAVRGVVTLNGLNNQRNSNQPMRTGVNRQPGSVGRFQNTNRFQGRQPIQQVHQRQILPQQGRTAGQSSQISGIISRNRPLVQTASSNRGFPRTQTLRTGRTGQLFGIRPRSSAPRVPAVRRRPPPPPDPFTRRFSAGFVRGSNLLVQPPLENTTFFNADGSRVVIDSDRSGNVIRRTVLGPGGMPQPPMPFGNGFLPPGAMFGGPPGGFGGGFGII